jgi:hypothetical protein
MELNAEMNTVMTERFNVAGAMLVKLFGRPDDETRRVRRLGRAPWPTSACAARWSAGCSS